MCPMNVHGGTYNRCYFRRGVEWIAHIQWIGHFDDISVIYMTAHRYSGGLKKNVDLRSGLQARYISQGSLMCPSKPKWGNIFTVVQINRPFQSPFTTRMGIRRTYQYTGELRSDSNSVVSIIHENVFQSKRNTIREINHEEHISPTVVLIVKCD